MPLPLPVADSINDADCLPALARRVSSREAILDAAEAVVLADGAAHLTLDAVAERAKISKGGLLYNFRTKEALLQAMIDRQVRRIEASRLQAMEDLPPQPGRELKACVLMVGDARLHGERRLGCATLAATANNPQALEPIRAAHRRRLDWITEGGGAAGLPFARSAVIRPRRGWPSACSKFCNSLLSMPRNASASSPTCSNSLTRRLPPRRPFILDL